jgi:catechol 2,3-dioxygenase-like lactoylglutathione lyase family enzyme
MPEFTRIVPVLKVSDLPKSIDFYTRILGFELGRRTTDEDGDSCMLHAGSVSMLLSTGAHLGGEPQFTGTLYFHMTGVDAYFERVKDQVAVVWPLETMDYGLREFGVRDCDGYTLAFSEAVPAE